jgi:hypothetical protein
MTHYLIALKTEVDQKKLDALVQFLKSWDIDAEIQPASTRSKRTLDPNYVPFSESLGMWKDRDDIDARKLRKKILRGYAPLVSV